MKALFEIKEVCHVDWHKMSDKGTHRYCDSCMKNVMDFSRMSQEEILEHLRKTASGTCGNFRDEQLQSAAGHYKIEISATKETRKVKLSGSLWIGLGTLLLSACHYQRYDFRYKKTDYRVVLRHDSEDSSAALDSNKNSSEISPDGKAQSISYGLNYSFAEGTRNRIIWGMIKPLPDTIEIIPPFFMHDKLGFNDYMRKHVVYPEKDRKKGNEAKISLRFIVDRNGKVHNIIFKNNSYSERRFRKAILKVLRNMPVWQAATYNNDKITQEVLLDFEFKIN